MRPSWSSGKTLAANAEGSWVRIPPRAKFVFFSQFTLFYRVECEKLFCKTNIKLKVLKLNKTKFISKPRHEIEKIINIYI